MSALTATKPDGTLTAARAIVFPATQEWAYGDIEADYLSTDYQPGTVWREVSESFYWQAMEVLPPVYADGGFLVGEPWRHMDNGQPLRVAFSTWGGRYFAIISTRKWLPALVQQLRYTLTHGEG